MKELTYEQWDRLIEKTSDNQIRTLWIDECQKSRTMAFYQLSNHLVWVMPETWQRYRDAIQWYKKSIRSINDFGPMPLP